MPFQPGMLVAFVLVLVLAGGATRAASCDDGWSALGDGEGKALLIRHAEAPGTGDPPDFRLEDCATQRNLSAEGLAHATALGRALRERGVRVGRVLTSQWCRARDSARLMDVGPVEDAPALNSFFDERTARAERTAALRDLVRGWRGPGALVLVTHQVNIAALTGLSPAAGEMIVLSAAREAEPPHVLGRIALR